MFDRFTASGVRAMTAAREEAIDLGHNYLGTEHLLLGVLHTDVCNELFAPSGLTLDDARARIVELVGGAPASQGEEEPTTETPSTPRAMDVLVLAWQEARSDNDIGPEHILLALLKEGQGVAARVSLDVGITEEGVRQALRSK